MKRVLFICLALLSTQAFAQAWYGGTGGGQQPITYTYPHVIGDGSNARGGEAPYFANEPDDIPTPSAIKTAWTRTDTGILSNSEFNSPPGGNCTGFPSSSCGSGSEAKARFDCNDTFDEPSDPILKPGESGTNLHDHHFFGNTAAQGNMALVTYSYLRNNGYSTCYGGPMNRTLYWEPTMYVVKNGVPVSLRAYNIVTYYISPGSISTSDTAKVTRWPRGLAMIFGFDMNDPNNTRITNKLNNVGGTYTDVPSQYSMTGGGGNGFVGWYCTNPATPSYTAYAPNQSQGAGQPYLNDAAGHATLNCLPTTMGWGDSNILVYADLNSPPCWDGHNPASPGGRSHVQQGVRDSRASASGYNTCPDGWYLIPQFQAKITFAFKDATEMANAYLSSDRMVGMTQWKGGQSMHADLIPAWDYGTGDNPGFMLKFFQHCDGLTMHVKNSDGVTYTDLVGDPHECGYGRLDATTNTSVNEASRDGNGPNPVMSLSPDLSGIKRYFPIPNGTPLPGSVLHQKH